MAIVEQVITVPKWADRITVQRAGDTLMVHGEGRIFEYAVLSPKQDFLRLYTEYAKQWAEKRSGKKQPHIQFANCRTDADLIHFIERFGPVSAASGPLVYHVKLKTIDCPQHIEALRRDRVIFAGAAKLVEQFGSGKKGDAQKVAEAMGEIAQAATPHGYGIEI